MKSYEDKDGKLEKPEVGAEGFSDPVIILINGGRVLPAVWDSRDMRWHTFENGDEETFDGGVERWFKLPKHWVYDSEFYTPLKYKEWWRSERNEMKGE